MQNKSTQKANEINSTSDKKRLLIWSSNCKRNDSMKTNKRR